MPSFSLTTLPTISGSQWDKRPLGKTPLRCELQVLWSWLDNSSVSCSLLKHRGPVPENSGHRAAEQSMCFMWAARSQGGGRNFSQIYQVDGSFLLSQGSVSEEAEGGQTVTQMELPQHVENKAGKKHPCWLHPQWG